jgi:hypothetical protein
MINRPFSIFSAGVLSMLIRNTIVDPPRVLPPGVASNASLLGKDRIVSDHP